jgi:hypothetical protein
LRLGLLLIVVAALGAWLADGHAAKHAAEAQASRHTLSSLPLSEQGMVSAALGADDSAYAVRLDRHGRYMVSSAQHLRLSFTRSGIVVVAARGRLALRLAGAGSGGPLRPVGEVSPRANANRIVYPSGAVSEWYTNGPLGVEQGFTVARPIRGGGSGSLTLSLALGGNLHPILQRDGRGVVFIAAGGEPVLRYRGLVAADSRGHTLNARLSLGRGSVLVRVDARHARYPVRIDPFIQSAELVASDGAAGDEFGDSVAVSGSTIAVGAPEHTVSGQAGRGVVYVFSASASGKWQNAHQTADLTASDGASGDGLGSSVAVSGTTIVAGAPDHGSGGSTYVFSASGSGQWHNATQTAELRASDGAAGDELGYSVAISGSTVVAGAPEHTVSGEGGRGAVYVFAAPASGRWQNGTQTAELSAPDGSSGDELGYAASISGSTIAATAPSHTVNGHAGQGAAYVFSAPASGRWQNGTQTAELIASDGSSGDQLGDSIAVSGSTIAAGAVQHAVGANSEQGAVYVFSKSGAGSWRNATQTAELTASDGTAGDGLGYAVAVDGSTIAAGAPEHTVAGQAGQGAAYVFSAPASGVWRNGTQGAELTASDGAAGDSLGSAVAVSGSTITVGAPLHAVASLGSQGSAYVFAGPPPPKPAPLTVTDVKQSHSVWREGNRLASITRVAKRTVPLGTTFSFKLNRPAYVSFGFMQQLSGREVGRKCVAQSTQNHARRACERSIPRGALAFVGHLGTSKVFFEGVLPRSRRLPAGRYTLTILAADVTGVRSRPRLLSFTVE